MTRKILGVALGAIVGYILYYILVVSIGYRIKCDLVSGLCSRGTDLFLSILKYHNLIFTAFIALGATSGWLLTPRLNKERGRGEVKSSSP